MNLFLILAAVAISVARFFVPTVGHSWPMVFIALAHIYVGMLIVLLLQKRGNWLLGWICLAVPTLLEAVLFFLGWPK